MNNSNPGVLLISVDALKPEFVFEQARLGINLPNITKYFIENGTYATKGVKSVFPTFTYPCHQSIITGTYPATHGIENNIIFDPMGEHNGAWHWFATNKVKTLWELAKENSYISASVAFPTSVGAKGDYIAPEFWWDGSALDSLFIDALATPQGLVLEMEQDIGRYAGGLDLSENGDNQRYKAAMWMLENKLKPRLHEKPFFLSAYFASYDDMAHDFGVYSQEAIKALEKIDMMIGKMVEEAHRITNDNVVVCVISDHGTLDNQYNISPNVLLKEAGLIEIDEGGKVINWRAWSQRAGGTSEIRLKDVEDKEAANILKTVMDKLVSDPESGILKIVNKEEAKIRRGFPKAEYALVAKKGYEIRDNVEGPYCTTKVTQPAQHGYDENFEEMRASFMIEGKGIAANNDIGELKLVDIAPTLAAIMGFSMPEAEGVNILK